MSQEHTSGERIYVVALLIVAYEMDFFVNAYAR